MFRIDLLPAEYGDAIWIEYGEAQLPHRVLIDCGTSGVFDSIRDRILGLPEGSRHFELLVVSHIDIDHIGGALDLLRESHGLGVTFSDIWFNGYVHLTPGGVVPQPDADDVLGPLQGEELTRLLVAEAPGRWNAAVQGRALVVPDSGPVEPTASLPAGLVLTLLSPTQRKLDRLKPVWDSACRKAGIVPGTATAQDDVRLDETQETEEEDDLLGDPDVGRLAATPFMPDRSKPNGSSLALLAEYAGRRALLAADAHAPVLVDALSRLPGHGAGRLRLDAVKLSHHGSRGNTSLDLVRAVQCPNWLVSTNGKQFQHPDAEAIARVIAEGGHDVTLHFNYRTEHNNVWASAGLRRKHCYVARYPSDDRVGIRLDLSP